MPKNTSDIPAEIGVTRVATDKLGAASMSHDLPPIGGATEGASESGGWSESVPFESGRPPNLPLSSAIPETLSVLRDFIGAVAEEKQVVTDAVAPLVMGIVSLAASRSFEVSFRDTWREPAPLWMVVMLDCGERKSPLLRCLTVAFDRWEDGEKIHLGGALTNYQTNRNVMEARHSGLLVKIGRAEPGELEVLHQEIAKLATQLSATEELAIPSLITTDITPETMRDLLAKNGEKLGLVTDECDAQLLMGARYSNAPNMDLFLQSFSGDRSRTHRKGRQVELSRPALALVLAVQPAALQPVLRDAMASGRGLIQRMLLIHPDSLVGGRKNDPDPIPRHLQAWWDSAITKVLNVPWPGRVVVGSSGVVRHDGGPRVLPVDPDARLLMNEMRSDTEAKLAKGAALGDFRGFGSKLPGAILRIALAFQVLQDPESTSVGVPAVKAALAWVPFLVGHYRSSLGHAAESPEERNALELLDALRRNGATELTERDAFRLLKGRKEMATMERFRVVLRELEGRNFVRYVQREEPLGAGPGRPHSPTVEVNPTVFRTN